MRKKPFASLTAENIAPVALFLTSTLAPGITPPEASTTVPDREAVEPLDWAYADEVIAARSAAISTKIRTFIAPPRQEQVKQTGRCTKPDSARNRSVRLKVEDNGRADGRQWKMSRDVTHLCR